MATYDRATAQRTYRNFKAALTRTQNRKDWHGVIAVAKRFRDYYRTSDEPMPDFWHRWQIAAVDAYIELRRQGIQAERVDFD